MLADPHDAPAVAAGGGMSAEIVTWIVGAALYVGYQWHRPGGRKLVWAAAIIVAWTDTLDRVDSPELN